jgi:parallel beta-helix repeat protein
VESNTVENATGRGIFVSSAPDASVHENQVSETEVGIRVTSSNTPTVVYNTVTDNSAYGIEAVLSPSAVVQSNTGSGNPVDIFLDRVANGQIGHNTMYAGVVILGTLASHYDQDLGDSTVNGAPIEYFYMVEEPDVQPGAGQVLIIGAGDLELTDDELGEDIASLVVIDSGDVNVTDASLDPGMGIYVRDSQHVVVEDVQVAGASLAGVKVLGSASATVSEVTVTNALGRGVWLEDLDAGSVNKSVVTSPQGTGIFVLSVTGPVIDDNSVTDGGSKGLWVEESDDAEVTNNIVTDVAGDGIGFLTALAPVISENTVSSNEGHGVVLGDWAHESIDDAVVQSNQIVGNDGVGLIVSRSPDVLVENNTIDGNALGVEIIVTDRTVLQDNRIRDNLGHGVDADAVREMLVVGNTITGNQDHGVIATQNTFGNDRSIEILENTVSTNAYGVSIASAGTSDLRDVEIIGNTMRDNTQTGIVVLRQPDETVDLLINDNRIEGNGVGLDYDYETGFDWSTATDLDARDNWWGAVDGPSGGLTNAGTSHVANGDGDSIVSLDENNVIFFPFDTDPPLAEPFFEVEILSTNTPVDEGESLLVEVKVTNTGPESGTQTIELLDPARAVADSEAALSLAAGEDDTFTLAWATEAGDWGIHDLAVRSLDHEVGVEVAVHPVGPVGISACVEIPVPGTFNLGADLTASQTCIVITSGGVTFDGGGHTITGQNLAAGSQRGVYVDGWSGGSLLEDVVVRDVHASGWSEGFWLRDVRHSEFEDLTASDSITNGFRFTGASQNTVTGVVAQDNPGRGIMMDSSSNNAFEDVVLANNTEEEISFSNRGTLRFIGSFSNSFDGLVISEGGHGLRILSGTFNSFENVEVTHSDTYGIEVLSNSNTFQEVHVSGGGWGGIRVGESNSNLFEDIVTTDNDGNGFWLSGSGTGSPASSGNTIRNLTATENSSSGVHLNVAHNNEFEDLVLGGNAGSPLSMNRAHNNEFTGVVVLDAAGTAVSLENGAVGNQLRDLDLSDVGGAAVMFVGTNFQNQDNLVSNVTAQNVGQYVVFGGSAGWIEGNRVEWFQADGMNFSIEADFAQVNPVDEPPEPPLGGLALPAYVELLPAGGAAFVEELVFFYDEEDALDHDEETLSVWRYDDSIEQWNSTEKESFSSSVNIVERSVTATGIEDFSVFGVFSEVDDVPEIVGVDVQGHLEVEGVVHASAELVVEATVTSDLSLARVWVELKANKFSFVFEQDLVHDSEDLWTTTIDLADVPDDGEYTLVVGAANIAGLEAIPEEGVDVKVDRVTPSLSAVVSGFELVDTDVVVNVTITSSKKLEDGSLEVSLERSNGEIVAFDGPFEMGLKQWAVEFEAEGLPPVYRVEAEGTSLAGVEGSSKTMVNVVMDLFNSPTLFIEEESGVFFEANGTSEESSVFVLTQGSDAPVETGPEFLGFSFVTGDHDVETVFVEGEMLLGIPVDIDALDGMDPHNVSIHYYTNGAWEALPTVYHEDFEHENETIDGGSYWIATGLSGFSSYGAMAEDDEPPEITLVEPGETVFPEGTSEVVVEFSYEDDISGVDVTSIEVTVREGGTPITVATSITSQKAVITVPVQDGLEYEVVIEVSDHAENMGTETFAFEIEGTPDQQSGPGGGGFMPPADDSGDDAEDGSSQDDEDGPPGQDDETDPGTTEPGDVDPGAEADDGDERRRDTPGPAAVLVLLLVGVVLVGLRRAGRGA